MAVRLDPVDWRILKELQADGSMTNVALASRVGLSAPPCLRRVRALEEAGLIAGYTVLLDEAALGLRADRLRHGRAAQSGRGRAARLREPRAWLAHRARGLHAVGRKRLHAEVRGARPAGFQEFVLEELTAAPNVASVKTFLTIRRAKREPGVPISVPEK